jgi:hypothetical protein
MKEQQSKIHKVLSLAGALITAFSLIFMASVAVSGQTISLPSAPSENSGSPLHGITFPITELGGCASKNECKSYCNEPANMDVCIAFAKNRGLMTEKDATRAGKFGKMVREGNGPGGCNSPQSCDTYCSDISHLDECTAFAEKNGFKGDQYEHGKKIQAFLKNGGMTPGNCQTKEECQSYCGDFSHAKECFDFAQKAGIMQKDGKGSSSGNRHEPNAEQLSKIAELSQNGETPGHCRSKDECEKYCSDQSHREECVDFGVKIGFIQPDEAAKIKEMGGKGPGDCNSPESCRAYCNDQSHHEECFKFAEEHGFITKEESTQAKEGWVRARQGFENAPPKIQECLKTTLDTNTLADIQSGKLVPGPDIGNQVRGCFEKFGGNVRPQEVFKNISPEVAACLKEKFGDTFDKIRTGKASTTPEMADSFRECFRDSQMKMGRSPMEMEDETNTRGRRNEGQENFGNQGSRGERLPEQTIQDMLRSVPPEVAPCLKEKFPDGFPALMGDKSTGTDIKDKVRECFEDFHSTTKPVSGMISPEKKERLGENAEPGQRPPSPVGGMVNMSPEVIVCIRGAIGEDNFQKIQTAPASLELIGIIRACLEKIQNTKVSPPLPTTTLEPMTFLEKFIGAALLPVRWILGK